MQLNYTICKHFDSCEHLCKCIFAEPHKAWYPCIEYDDETSRAYLNKLVINKGFRYNFRFHLFNFLKANSFRVPNAQYLYYYLEKDDFFMTGIPLIELFQNNAVKDQLNSQHHYYNVPINFNKLTDFLNNFNDVLPSFNSNKKTFFHSEVDAASKKFFDVNYKPFKTLF